MPWKRALVREITEAIVYFGLIPLALRDTVHQQAATRRGQHELERILAVDVGPGTATVRGEDLYAGRSIRRRLDAHQDTIHLDRKRRLAYTIDKFANANFAHPHVAARINASSQFIRICTRIEANEIVGAESFAQTTPLCT